ncbi:MAG: hypothetical protein A3I05_02940 [Deltaproteobacteria bacterium RIFCSPLOWO2_02_FULL_44_10]|nr:MAG: hypothetical protein A3C46_05710 [Deltaproteobacteria bacterium RIFCSPHIGHO2_02_FULL_44_16]OGQ45085.1 MAG: hypothetical protein A3I05_02940 [Deltaproteobacteria bacterium RIFCSPLOWO2_02_FULL_44_10]
MPRKSSSFNTSAELKILEHLSEKPQNISQREIARRSGFSVGLINAVIRRLVTTGYVKTSRLNRRSLEYLLTSEGFARKAMKSYRYVLKTVQNYHAIHLFLVDLFQDLQQKRIKKFYLYGNGEMATLVENFFYEARIKGKLSRSLPRKKEKEGIILNVTSSPYAKGDVLVIDLMCELEQAMKNCNQKEQWLQELP